MASLNEIHGMVGKLTASMESVNEKVDDLRDQIRDSEKASSESRANVHRRLDDLVMRTTHLESDMSATKNKVEGMEKVTVEVTTLRTKAEGAGTLGYWLLRAGGFILSAAGGFAAAYTYLTGRPPP